jgi:hypothetical protein
VLFEQSEMQIPVETEVGVVRIGRREVEVGEAASMRAVAPKIGDAGPETGGAGIHCRRGGTRRPTAADVCTTAAKGRATAGGRSDPGVTHSS